jgi:2-polyprenyl-3-methyl-5-hydroxy-6-metoxy-1,4-benzoquinol methylase
MTQSGVMDGEYARARRRSRVLQYRYRTRAWIAYQAARRHLPELDGYHVLDLGAAEGKTLLELRRLLGGRGRFTGIEASAELIKSAATLPPDTKLLLGDVHDPPPEVEDESFDLVLALAVLEHVDSPERVAEIVRRKLKPNGVFVATCPHPVWDDVAGRMALLPKETHLHEMTRERLETVGRIVGQVEYEPFMLAFTGALPYIGISMSPQASTTLDRWISRLPLPFVRHLFVNQVVVATKR